MRGLYLLAVGISFLIGSGLGIFFYTFAKYWVGAAGGFSFGWFLIALRKGGLVNSVGPRWAIIGGLTVAATLAALTPQLHEYVLLIASAWVGATAFTLGVDCFTRAGLKEVSGKEALCGDEPASAQYDVLPLTPVLHVQPRIQRCLSFPQWWQVPFDSEHAGRARRHSCCCLGGFTAET